MIESSALPVDSTTQFVQEVTEAVEEDGKATESTEEDGEAEEEDGADSVQGEEDGIESTENEEETAQTNAPTQRSVPKTIAKYSRIRLRTPRQPPKPTEFPIRTLVLPSLSPQMIQEQQARFDTFLQQTHDFQTAGTLQDRQALYRIHHEAGLGNMIRGYLSTFTVGILTNRAIQRILSTDFSHSENTQEFLLQLLCSSLP